MSIFYKLSVKEIKQETKNAVSILFAIPVDLQQKFCFIPGQYITIKKEFDGKEIRRAYSICSSKESNAIRIGVKAVDKGTFSVFATTELKVGDVLEVSPPEGRFILIPNTENHKNYLAFAAGSGITPVLSMIKSVLESEPKSNFVLVYGNKSPGEAMFKKEIDTLRSEYPDQFVVYYTYTKVNEEDALFGRIDKSTVNYVVKNKHKEAQFDDFFLCGPEEMINIVMADLLDKGISKEKIHLELFSSTVDVAKNEEKLEGETLVTILLDDEEISFSMDREKSILEAALAKGLDAPYSCQGGICSSCLAQIKDGKAVMDKNTILTDEEVEDGLILTCQAHPITDKITIDYDAV